MKLLLLVALGVVASLGDEAQVLREFAAENVLYVGELYKELLTTHSGNFIVCPLSLQSVFALVNGGAKGNTAKQITKGLHLPEGEEKVKETFIGLVKSLQTNDKYTMSSANKVYLANYFKISEKYKNTAVNVFHSEIQNIDFGKSEEAANEINKWVEGRTHDKIKKLLSPDVLSGSTVAVLVNAMYFQGTWVTKFEDVQRLQFNLDKKNSVITDVMAVKSEFNFIENRELQAKFLELPYEGDAITLTVVLPNDVEGLPALEARIGEVLVAPRYLPEVVDVKLPKFKIESTTHLIPILQKLGITDAFTGAADFTGIGENQEPLSISEVLQKSFIEVDEKGTTAAAATAVMVNRSGRDYEPEFLATHPFLFYLKHRVNGIFFVGRYSRPA